MVPNLDHLLWHSKALQQQLHSKYVAGSRIRPHSAEVNLKFSQLNHNQAIMAMTKATELED